MTGEMEIDNATPVNSLVSKFSAEKVIVELKSEGLVTIQKQEK